MHKCQGTNLAWTFSFLQLVTFWEAILVTGDKKIGCGPFEPKND